jgi:hypothetical protein
MLVGVSQWTSQKTNMMCHFVLRRPLVARTLRAKYKDEFIPDVAGALFLTLFCASWKLADKRQQSLIRQGRLRSDCYLTILWSVSIDILILAC